jgi:hypothetical protein
MVNINDCKLEDVNLLAEMNKQLVEDEKSNNIIDITQLKNRMVDFLNKDIRRFCSQWKKPL